MENVFVAATPERNLPAGAVAAFSHQVDAYMKVRQENDELQTEDEFFTDCINSLRAYFKRFKLGWPQRDKLASALQHDPRFRFKKTIGFKQLHATGLFRKHESIKTFLQHYGKFDFLQPPEINDYGLVHKFEKEEKDEWMLDEIERRVAFLLGKPKLTLTQSLHLANERQRQKSMRDEANFRDVIDAAKAAAGPHADSLVNQGSASGSPSDLPPEDEPGRAPMNGTADNGMAVESVLLDNLPGTLQKYNGRMGRVEGKSQVTQDSAGKRRVTVKLPDEIRELPIECSEDCITYVHADNNTLSGGQSLSQIHAVLQDQLIKLGVSSCGVQLALKALDDALHSNTQQHDLAAAGNKGLPHAQIEWRDIYERGRMPVQGVSRSESRLSGAGGDSPRDHNHQVLLSNSPRRRKYSVDDIAHDGADEYGDATQTVFRQQVPERLSSSGSQAPEAEVVIVDRKLPRAENAGMGSRTIAGRSTHGPSDTLGRRRALSGSDALNPHAGNETHDTTLMSHSGQGSRIRESNGVREARRRSMPGRSSGKQWQELPRPAPAPVSALHLPPRPRQGSFHGVVPEEEGDGDRRIRQVQNSDSFLGILYRSGSVD